LMLIRYTVSDTGLCWEKKMLYCIEAVPSRVCQEVTIKFYSWDHCYEQSGRVDK